MFSVQSARLSLLETDSHNTTTGKVVFYIFINSIIDKSGNCLCMEQIFLVFSSELFSRLSVSEKQLEDLKTESTGKTLKV